MNEPVKILEWNVANKLLLSDKGEPTKVKALDQIYRHEADIIILPETGVYKVHSREIEDAQKAELTARMEAHGYTGVIVPTSSRDLSYDKRSSYHHISMWKREERSDIGEVSPEPDDLAGRNSLSLWIPGMGTRVRSLHSTELYERRRIDIARAVIDTMVAGEELILGGDLNGMSREDPKSWPFLAAFCLGVGLPEVNYYDGNKVDQILSFAVRCARMGVGQARHILKHGGGLHTADPSYQTTCSNKGLDISIDAILGTSGILFEGFSIGSNFSPDGTQLSDHQPLVVTARRVEPATAVFAA